MAVPAQEDLGSFILESVVRGHHVYKEVWTPLVGEELDLEREHGNSYDHYATTVKWLLGMFPENSLKIFGVSGGEIECEVTGRRRKGKGLEVPCVYKLQGKKQLLDKLRHS